MEFLQKLIDMYIAIYAHARSQHAVSNNFQALQSPLQHLSKPLSVKFTVFWEKLTSPSWPQTCGCLPVGAADRGPAGHYTCVHVGAADFGGQLQKPSVLKANAEIGPDPGSPACWPP